jgi:hypothetical protein
LLCATAAIALAVPLDFAHAQPPSQRRIPYSPAAPLASPQPAVAILLAQAEYRLTAFEASSSNPSDLAEVESEINLALLQATGAAERIQARRLLRRLKRIESGQPPLKPEITQAGYQSRLQTSGMNQASPGSDPLAPTSINPSSPLAPLAAAAARLAQYGAPATEADCAYPTDPGFAPAAPGYSMAPTYSVVPVAPIAAAVCTPPPRHYVAFDALGWWMKGDPLPALVTTSPGNTPLSEAGIIGLPTTTVAFGNGNVNDSLRWGGRVTGGVWLDDFQTFAVEGHYYGFPSVSTGFSQTSVFTDGTTDDAILARPFFNTAPGTNVQQAVLVAFPGLVVPPSVVNVDGTITAEEKSSFQSAGIGGRYGLFPYNNPYRVFLLGAYRFIDLNESLTISSSSSATVTPFPIPIPTDGTVQIVDSFATRNIFNGGELGASGEYVHDRWSLAVLKRIALGNMNQQVKINGRTSAVFDNYVASYAGGVLAQPTNIGTFTQNKFAWIPELDIKLGYQLLPRMRLTVGYNLTYISSVVRPGGQVNTNVNTTQIAGQPLVGPPDPTVTMNTTSIWLQGFTTGIDFRF